jgi:hypothetical protein
MQIILLTIQSRELKILEVPGMPVHILVQELQTLVVDTGQLILLGKMVGAPVENGIPNRFKY